MSEPARSFQHYEVLRREDGAPWELGRGAMGVTFKAFDVNLCCEVALKVVSTALVEHPEARERFVREARAAAALRHRNVASVYHLGNDGEHFFYAMEFINGETLDALVRRSGPLSVPDTLRVVLQVARALAAAARQGLVHRDIKPANLMVTHEDADEETVVKVIDFGLARAAATADNAPPLTIGGFVGTPQFASPEQLEERPLDARSDLYSLGVTAWFLLTGRVPFSGSLATVCQQQLTQPPPWEHLPGTLPPCVRDLLARTLEKSPARRPQTAVELRAEIENCLDHVQGSVRRRDLHLSALAAADAATGKNLSKPAGRLAQAGTLLNGRYRLLREVGDSRGGVRVYQARDESDAETPVAVKILPDEISSGTVLRNRWETEARLAQAAPHPNLVRILTLERSLSPDTVFLVEEWIAGWTLRDLVAGRGGALPVTETLRLLEQAALAADHADGCRLEHLELGARHLHVCFPTLPAFETRTLLPQSMMTWPDWTLKTHAIKFADDPLGLDTWAGGETLVPAARSGVGVRLTQAATPEGRYVPALARLVYELLGGKAPDYRREKGSRPGGYALLPVLNEEANSLLRSTLSGETVFTHGREWYEGFARAVGDAPARGDARTVAARATTLPLEDSKPPEADPESPPASVFTRAEEDFSSQDAHDPVEPESGSAWDRLTLVGAERVRPGRWLAGIVGLAAVFVLGFVGVLVWLLQQPPARGAAAPAAKTLAPDRTTPARRPVPTHQATPAPLAAAGLGPVPTPRSSVAPTPLPATVRIESTPIPSATAFARVENLSPTPAPNETTPVPPAATPHERTSTMVRMDSVPEGAQIRLGDEILGVTPCRVRLPLGDHQLIARYQDWPETRQTVRLIGTEPRLAVEIRLMRPDLVPDAATSPPATPDVRARRIPASAAHHAVPIQPGTGEPEVRPAQRVLTPFRLDAPENAASPTPSAPGNRQPFSPDDRTGT